MVTLLSIAFSFSCGWIAASQWAEGRRLLAVAVFALGVFNPLHSAHASEVEAVTKLRQTTVHIAIGSGSIVEGPSGNHYLLTNQHVCNSGSWKNKMRGNMEGGRLIEGQIVKTDWAADLCASRIIHQPLAIKIADTFDKRGTIYTRGYPYGVLSETSGHFVKVSIWTYVYPLEDLVECPNIMEKRYDNLHRLSGCAMTYRDNMTNMYARPGSSGSPVVNEDGDLIGVMSSWNSKRDEGGMVPFDSIQKFMKDL